MALLELASVPLPLNEMFSVKISGHRVVQDGQYVLYTVAIVLDPYTWTVERRYSDFATFDKLRFPDRQKSFLPKKKIHGNLNEEFIAERQIELEKYLKSVLELEIWYQKQKNLCSLPLLFARFLDFHQYEVHSIVDDLSFRLSRVGDGWLAASASSPKYFEFTPIELHALGRRLLLPEPGSQGRADIAHLMEFAQGVRSLKVRGSRGYIGTASIICSTLEMHLGVFRKILALWLVDSDVRNIRGHEQLRDKIRSLTVHYSMTACADLLAADLDASSLAEDEDGGGVPAGTWNRLENADFSFNQLEQLDHSFRFLPKLRYLNLSHNKLECIGRWLTLLPSLSELDLSGNELEKLEAWHEKLGNIKKLSLARNRINDLSGLSRLFSLEELDVSENDLASPDAIAPIGLLPCLDSLHLEGNPICDRADYRTRVLEAFEERAGDVSLDGKRASSKERDTVGVRVALRRAAREKEARHERNARKAAETIRCTSESSEQETN